MIEALEHLDMDVTLAINQWHAAWSDPMWLWITRSKSWTLFYIILIGIIVWKLGWKRGLIVIAGMILSVGIVDQFATLIKDSVARLRPCCDERMVDAGLVMLLKPGKHIYGFFSAHAGTAMALAVGAARCFLHRDEGKGPDQAWRIASVLIIAWAVVIGMSRVFVGRHFLGDVLAGWAVGALVGWVISLLCFRIPLRPSETPRES